MVPDRHRASSLPAPASLLFLALPGCRAGQSRAGIPSSPLSVASRERHVPARVRTLWHAPDTLLALASGLHVGSGIGHRHTCGATCPLAILRGTRVGSISRACPGAKPKLLPAQSHLARHHRCRSGYAGSAMLVSIVIGQDFGLPGVSPPTVVPEAVVAL